MVFGFGKKKIDISEAVSRCSAGARTIERWLRQAWDNCQSDDLPSFDENIDEIRFAIFYFSENILFTQLNLPEKEKDWLWEMIQIEGYQRAFEREPIKFNDPTKYGQKIDEVEEILESHKTGDPAKSLLHSLLSLIGTDEDKIPVIAESMSDDFNNEHMAGYVMNKNQFFENVKLVNDEEADDLLEFMKNRVEEFNRR